MSWLARTAAFAAGLAALVWVLRETQWSSAGVPRTLLFVVVPLAVMAGVVGVAFDRRRWIVVAGAVAAVSPAVLGQLGAAQRHGLVAVGAIVVGLAVGPVHRRSSMAAGVLAGAFSLGALASWWSVTPERIEGPSPNWANLASSVGSWIERSTGGLGVDALPAPTSAMLAWWLAVGVVAGAAVACRRDRLVAVPVGAIVAVVIVSAVFERWRGPVNPIAGSWLPAGSIAFVASRVELPRRPSSTMAATVGGLVAWSWWGAAAAHVRFVADDRAQPAAWSRWLDWGNLTDGRSASVLLPVAAVGALAVAVAHAGLTGRSHDPRGVNVVGYHSITGGLGERTRELTASLDAAGVPVAAVDLAVDSERDSPMLPPAQRRYATTVVATPAFEVGIAAATHPDLFVGRRLVAGYWFWELDAIPESHRTGIEYVDEIWAPTRFVRDAYRPVTAIPVRHVPIPVREPSVAHLARPALHLPDDAVVFLCSFSHLSVMERKNPLDTISAFRQAFPTDDADAGRFRLVIKTLNGDRRPEDAATLRSTASDDDRIDVRDGRVEHDELMALIAASDVYVSLHRSEGLGLHIADAMWLGTTVVATDYSGSRDLVDRDVAEPIPWHPTPVRNGDGAYPEAFTWAQPDVEAAALAMRRLAGDPDRRRRLADAARQRMEAQPDREAVGRALAKLARCR